MALQTALLLLPCGLHNFKTSAHVQVTLGLQDLPRNDTGTLWTNTLTTLKTAHVKTVNAFITSRSSSWYPGYKCSTFCFGSFLFELFGKCIWAVCRSSCFFFPLDFVDIRNTSPKSSWRMFSDFVSMNVSLNCLAIIPGIFSSRSSVHLGEVKMEAGWIKSLPALRLRWWWDMLIRWVKCKQLTKARMPKMNKTDQNTRMVKSNEVSDAHFCKSKFKCSYDSWLYSLSLAWKPRTRNTGPTHLPALLLVSFSSFVSSCRLKAIASVAFGSSLVWPVKTCCGHQRQKQRARCQSGPKNSCL